MLFNSGHVDYEDGRFVINQEELSKRHAGTLALGVSVSYLKLHAGLSTSLPLYRKKEVVQEVEDFLNKDSRLTVSALKLSMGIYISA